MRAKCNRLGTIFKGILASWQGSFNACCVHNDVRVLLSCGTLKSTWVKNSFVLDGRLIDLQCTQAPILFSCCWCSTFCIGILFGHVPEQVYDAARVAPLVVVPAHNLHEGGVQHDASLGIKVKEMGSVLKSVEANASSA